MGLNGDPVIFYTKQNGCPETSGPTQDSKHQELAEILKQMGLKVSIQKIKLAVKALHMDLSKLLTEDDTVIKTLFQYFTSGL